MKEEIKYGSRLKRSDYKSKKWTQGTSRRFYEPGSVVFNPDRNRYAYYGDINWDKGTQHVISTSNIGRITELTKGAFTPEGSASWEQIQTAQKARDRGVLTKKAYNDYLKKNYGTSKDISSLNNNEKSQSTSDIYNISGGVESGASESESESEFASEMKNLRSAIGDMRDFAGDLADTFSQQSEIYRKSFVDLQKALGDQSKLMQDQLEAFQKSTNAIVDISRDGFQEDIKAAMDSGADLRTVFEKYVVQEDSTDGVNNYVNEGGQIDLQKNGEEGEVRIYETPQGKVKATFQDGAWLTEKVTESPQEYQKETVETVPIEQKEAIPTESQTVSSKDQVTSALDNVIEIGGPDMWNQLGELDFEQMSSADALKILLMAQLQTIADPTTNEYLNRMSETAKESYATALALAETSIKEVDRAIDGDDFVPTTYAGLSAKIASQTKDLQLESINAEKTYRQEQFDNWMEQEQDKRARLEGYLKAKMYAAGAQDSVQGLNAMALSVNAADLRLQSAQSEHNYAMSRLNLQARSVMTDYANSVSKLALDIESAKQTAASDYNDELFKIEGLKIEDAQEKRKLSLQALSSFQEKSYQLEKDKKDRAWKMYVQSYNEMQDRISEAHKMAGETGTVWYSDKNGKMVDTGIPTFESKKWQETKWLDYERLKYTRLNNGYKLAVDIKEKGGDPNNIIEMFGLDPDVVKGIKSESDYEEFIDSFYKDSDILDIGVADLNSQAWQSSFARDGQSISLGIPDVDPMAFADIRESFELLDPYIKKITQDFNTPVNYLAGRSTHGGYDVVFKDGLVRSFNAGVVSDIIPDPNPNVKAGWGGRVIITDDYGRSFQYAHFNNNGIQVKKGDVVNIGDSLGLQGDAGYSFGAHTDYRYIGYDSNKGSMSPSPQSLGLQIPEQSGPAWYRHLLDKYADGTYSESEVKSAISTHTSDSKMAKLYTAKFLSQLDRPYGEAPTLPEWVQSLRDSFGIEMPSDSQNSTLRDIHESSAIEKSSDESVAKKRAEWQKLSDLGYTDLDFDTWYSYQVFKL